MMTWNMILQGSRKRDGLAVNGDPGHPSTQVTTNKLVTRTMPMQVTGLSHPSFLPTYKPCLAWGHAIFSHGGGEIEMRLLWWEVPRLHTHQKQRATCEQYPPRAISATLYFKKQTHCPPAASHVEITNNTQCTKCINIYSKFLECWTPDYMTTKYENRTWGCSLPRTPNK